MSELDNNTASTLTPPAANYPVIGILVGTASFSSIALNVSVMLTLKSKGFLTSRKSTVYSLSFAYIFADILEQCIMCFYVAPSIFTQSFLVGERDHPLVMALGFGWLVFWYMGMLYQIIIALDRVNSIVFRQTSIREYYRLIIALVWVVSCSAAYIGYFILPCCRFYVSYVNYGFAYTEGFNYSNTYLDVPFNVITTVTIYVCYTWIFLYIRRTNRINSISEDKMAERRQQEFNLARQFFTMALLFSFLWISFRTFPYMVSPNSSLLASIPISLSFHCSFNSIVFLSINNEFRKAYRQVLRGNMAASSSTTNIPNSTTAA